MPVYEYQGQHYDIDTTDAEAAKRKILLSLEPAETTAETVGGLAASVADTGLNLATGTLDMLARAPATAYHYATGPEGESFSDAYTRASKEVGTLGHDIIGQATGAANLQSYQQAPQRQLGEYLGQEYIAPAIQYGAEATGLPEQAVGDIAGLVTLPIAPGAGRAIAATGKGAGRLAGRGLAATGRGTLAAGRAAVAAPRAVGDFVGGATGALTGKIAKPGVAPEPWQTASARQPVGKTYYTPEQIEQLRAGQITAEQLTPQPIQNLGPEAMAALSRTEGNIPYAGKGMRAFGEQIGETYRNPMNLLTDVGLDVLTGGGLPTAARLGYKAVKGAKGAKAAKTLEKQGFTPLTADDLAAISGERPYPVAGPVAPVVAVTPRTAPPPGAGPDLGPGSGPVAPRTPPPTSPSVTTQPVTPAQIADQAQANMPAFKEPQVTAKPVAPDALPAATAAVGETAEQIAAKQNLIDLINRKRGVVTDNPAATRETFVNRVNETMDQLKQAREENKAQFGERATAMNEQAGQGSKQLGQKDIITEATAVRHMINQTSQSAVRQQGKQVSYNIAAYDDLAQQSATTLDWTTAPDITSMKIGDARQAMNKWMFEQINDQVPELGLKERATQQRTLQKQADEEMGLTGKEEFTPDELAAMDRRMNKLTKPKDAETKPPAISSSLQASLDKLKNEGKYRGPKDAMEMKTTPPTFANKDEFLKKSMMDKLKGEPTLGSYIDGDKRIEYTTRSVSGSPFKNIIDKTEYDVKTGKILKATTVTLGKPTK